MYVMRNIFHIPVDVDLAGALVSSESDHAFDLDHSSGFGADVGDFDQRLRALHRQIDEAQFRRKQLASSIQTTRAQLKISEACLSRMPQITELHAAANSLPVDRIEQLREKVIELLGKSRELSSESDPKRSLAFHKEAFVFD
jgi:predicted  nucleic acid-binding Zn-ribbon protein